MNMRSNPQKTRPTGRGNVPVARNPNPKPHKRQNQAIRKNNTIPQSNFYFSWGLSPEDPEIGRLSDSKLNRLAGIAPEEKSSGTKEWQRRIWGGRKDVRNALYMATTAGLQWNSILNDYYRKKRAEGHPHKWAMIPTMRKLLSLLNRIARDPNFNPIPEPESTKDNARAGRKKKTA